MSELIGRVDVVKYEDDFKTVLLSDGTRLYNNEPFDPNIIDSIFEYEDRYQLMLKKNKSTNESR